MECPAWGAPLCVRHEYPATRPSGIGVTARMVDGLVQRRLSLWGVPADKGELLRKNLWGDLPLITPVSRSKPRRRRQRQIIGRRAGTPDLEATPDQCRMPNIGPKRRSAAGGPIAEGRALELPGRSTGRRGWPCPIGRACRAPPHTPPGGRYQRCSTGDRQGIAARLHSEPGQIVVGHFALESPGCNRSPAPVRRRRTTQQPRVSEAPPWVGTRSFTTTLKGLHNGAMG